MADKENKTKWYIAGLHFECTGCGNCCAGPGEGYIWITKPEIKMLAEHLDITVDELHKKYLKREGSRTTIIEEAKSKDCIFLSKSDSKGIRGCAIYPVWPNQCRTWPFWSCNLQNANAWNTANTRCPGINRGKFYSFDQIENLRKQTKWWPDEE